MQKQVRWLVLLVALGLCSLLWRALSETPGAAAALPPSAKVEAAASRSPAELTVVQAQAAEPAQGTRRTLVSSLTSASQGSAHSEAGPELCSGTLVFLDEDQHQPVPGLEVWLLRAPTASLEQLLSAPMLDAALDAAQLAGDKRVPDARGRLELAEQLAPDESLLALAVAPGWLAQASLRSFPKPEREVLVSVRHDQRLCVRVESAEGAALEGLDVQLSASGRGWTRRVLSLRTDAGGLVVFAHLNANLMESAAAEFWAVGVEAITSQPVRREVDLRVPQPELLVLRCPAFGVVEVELVGPEDLLQQIQPRVSLELAALDGTLVDPGTSGLRGPPLEAQVLDGSARFEHVGVGLELLASVELGATGALLELRAPGPHLAGELVRLRADLASLPVVFGRVLGAEGQVLTDTVLQVQLMRQTGGSRLLESGQRRTTAEGLLFLFLDQRWSPGNQRKFTLQLGQGQDATQASLELDLSRDFEPGLHDLGDLCLGFDRLAFSGRVVDARGKPAAHAQVSATALETDPRASLGDTDLTGQSDAQGNFVLNGGSPGQRYALEATLHGSQRSVPLLLPHGTREVELRLEYGGALAGQVELGFPIPAGSLRYELRARGSDRLLLQKQLGADGLIEARPLSTGTYELSLLLGWGQPALATVPDLSVTSDQVTRDPRLNPLDLRGRCGGLQLNFELPPDTLELGGLVTWKPAGDPGAQQQLAQIRGRRLELLLASSAADVLVSANGCAPVQLWNVQGEQSVRLVPGLLVRLLPPPGLVLPEPPLYLRAELLPEASESFALNLEQLPFDGSNPLLVRAPGLGRMRVIWSCERRSGSSTMSSTLAMEREQFVVIREVPEVQSVQLELSQAELDGALANFNR